MTPDPLELAGGAVALHHGDCRDVLKTLPDNSVDSVVTDPPYELGFMGKAWDASGIAYSIDLWTECLRVLKPGGHLLAFGGTRTYHRMAVAIEDAGFEIRDSLHWVYGSGFPKSLDVSKAIDKAGGNLAEFVAFRDAVKAAMKRNNISRKSLEGALGNYMLSHYLTEGSQPAVPNFQDYVIIRDYVGLGDDFDHLFAPEAEREVVGKADNTKFVFAPGEGRDAPRVELNITAPATDAAKQWAGWGTALKPAHEPIVLARKPLVGTVAANVLQHGTGALNIDGCRVGSDAVQVNTYTSRGPFGNSQVGNEYESKQVSGRWPANVIFDTDAGAALDEQSGVSKDGVAVRHRGVRGGTIGPAGAKPEGTPDQGYGGSGGASRFLTSIDWNPEIDAPFRYVPKPSKKERNAGLDGLPTRRKSQLGSEKESREGLDDVSARFVSAEPVANVHPTVKPVALMRWLIRLITPPGGTVLDPFAGSGTTLMAAVLEGFDAIGIEMTDEYLPIIEGRVDEAHITPQQLNLFGGPS